MPSRAALGRVGLGGAVLLYAALATASGIDRMGAIAPPLAPRIPEPIAHAAVRGHAKMLLVREQYEAMVPLAQRAVRQSPMEPDSSALLGTALLGTGKPHAADAAFRVAGQLGWRDLPTQVYWMRVALAAHEYGIAAERLDALLRQDASLANRFGVTAPLERDAKGRAALAERLALAPDWSAAYFNPPTSIPPDLLSARAEVLSLLRRNGAETCAMAAKLSRRLVESGALRRAKDIWTTHCDEGHEGIGGDEVFAASAGEMRSPFAWVLVRDGSLQTEARGGGRTLWIRTSAAITRRFAQKLLVVPPGNYRLTWKASPGAAAEDRLVPGIACSGRAAGRLPVTARGDGKFSATFAIDDSCEGRALSFAVRPGEGSLILHDVSLATAE